MPSIKKPRDSGNFSLELSNLNPKHILEQAEWMGTPINFEDIQVFLKHLETVIFKYLVHEHAGILVTFTRNYQINGYRMLAQLRADPFKVSTIKHNKDQDTDMVTADGHTCYCLDAEKRYIRYTHKKGKIPLKTLPLLINHEFPTVRLLAKAKLQGLL